MDTNPFTAKWSAQGHTLCLGHWKISYLDLPLTLPDKQSTNDMNTHGNFSYMFPDDEEFIEGLEIEPWIEQNITWLLELFEQHNIPDDPQTILYFYQAVNKQDWRCSSCGGC